MKNKTAHHRTNKKAAANSTYKKLAVQRLNEALCFVSSLVLTDSFGLLNRQLLVAANRVCLESAIEQIAECFSEDGSQF